MAWQGGSVGPGGTAVLVDRRAPAVLVDRRAPAVLVPPAVREVSLVLAGVALLAASAQVAVPLPGTPVPVTGQTFAALLLGAAYGPGRAPATLLAYLLTGLAGVPVFAPDPATGTPGHGWHMLAVPSFGYLLGMVAASWLLGALSGRGWDRGARTAVPQMLLGTLVVYAVGVPWLAVAADLSPGEALAKGLVPFLAGDVLKVLLAAAALPVAWRARDAWARGRR